MTDGSGIRSRSGFPTGSGEQLYTPYLSPGTYTISVGGWAAGAGAGLSYQLLIGLGHAAGQCPALVDSPAPAIQVALADFAAFAGGSSGGSPPSPAVPIAASPIEGGTTGTVEGEAPGRRRDRRRATR